MEMKYALKQLIEPSLHQAFGLGVNGGGCLVENEDFRSAIKVRAKEMSCLSLGKPAAALIDLGLVAVFHFLMDKLIRFNCLAAATTSSSVASNLP